MFARTFVTFIAKFGSAIASLFIAVLASNILGASGKGEQSIIITTITVILTFTGLFGPAPLTYVISKEKKDHYLYTSYIWSFIIPAAIWGTLITFPLSNDKYTFDIILLSFISSISSSNLSITLIHEKTNKYNLLQASVPFSTILVLAIEFFVLKNQTLDAYISSLYWAYSFLFLISFHDIIPIFKRHPPSLNNLIIHGTSRLLKYGFFNQAATIVQIVSYRGCYYILSWMHGDDEVGIYSNAVSLAESIWLLSRSISLIMYARIINLSGNKNSQQKVTQRSLFVTGIIQIFAAVAIVLMPANLYVLIFGEEFIHTKDILILLLPGIIFYGQSLISGHYFSGTGKHYVNMISNIGGMIVVIIIAMILIPKFSYNGAAIATSVGYIVLLLIQQFYLKRYLQINVWHGLFSIPQYRLYLNFIRKTVLSRKRSRL